MANVFTNLPAPAGNGVGAGQDVSTMGRERTITVQGTFRGTVIIEFSNEAGGAGPYAQIEVFTAAGKKTVQIAAQFMRVRRSGVPTIDPGLPDVEVAANDNGGQFLDLPAPAGNGSGASIDVSALGTFNTIAVQGTFTGTVVIEISEDNVTWAQCMVFNGPGWYSKEFIAQFMRVTRKNVGVNPGLPNVDVGAINDAVTSTGGGGGTVTGTGTDNRLVRWNGTGVPVIQDSSWSLSDTGTMVAAGPLEMGSGGTEFPITDTAYLELVEQVSDPALPAAGTTAIFVSGNLVFIKNTAEGTAQLALFTDITRQRAYNGNRTLTLTNSTLPPVNVLTAIGTSLTQPGLRLENTTAATGGATLQNAPTLQFIAHRWDGVADESVTGNIAFSGQPITPLLPNTDASGWVFGDDSLFSAPKIFAFEPGSTSGGGFEIRTDFPSPRTRPGVRIVEVQAGWDFADATGLVIQTTFASTNLSQTRISPPMVFGAAAWNTVGAANEWISMAWALRGFPGNPTTGEFVQYALVDASSAIDWDFSGAETGLSFSTDGTITAPAATIDQLSVTSSVDFFGAGGVGQSAAYAPTNVVTDRAYDANSTTLDEVADVLGTLIADLQATGLLG